jgi:hypothetical protein
LDAGDPPVVGLLLELHHVVRILFQITCTKRLPIRMAVSSSVAVNRKPPSPDTEITGEPCLTMPAAIAQGRATPRVCCPLLTST